MIAAWLLGVCVGPVSSKALMRSIMVMLCCVWDYFFLNYARQTSTAKLWCPPKPVLSSIKKVFCS